MSSQITNNYATTPTFPNPYISRKLNNMEEAQEMKKKQDNWTKLYYKMLQGIETMIGVQKIVRDMKKIAEVANTTVMVMEGFILTASITNQTTNLTNILEISENLQSLIQSDIEDWIFQIQRILADKLNRHKGRENSYVDENIQEIQELYMNEEQQKEGGKVEEEEVILIRPYKVSSSMSSSTRSSSFANKKVNNLLKYMKFVKSPTQIRIFWPLLHYQSLRSRGEQDLDFRKKVVIAMVESKHNTETSRNGQRINMFQKGLPHKPFFIAIDNWGQIIIGPSKKMVAIYIVGKLKVLIWFMETWMLKMGYCYDWYLENATWRRAKSNNNTIGYIEVVSVSTSCSRCSILALSSCIMTRLPYRLQPVFSCLSHIYNVDTILYPYALPLIHLPILISSLCLRCNLSSTSKGHNKYLWIFEMYIYSILSVIQENLVEFSL